MIEESDNFDIEYLLNELAKSNISVLTLDTKKYLSDCSIKLLNTPEEDYKNNVNNALNKLRCLIMICNILYNRTDMLVLPVEDGVYDLLLELYKRFDPNFQVGSIVVDFVDKVEKISNTDKISNPIFFYDKVERDDIRKVFNRKLKSFDDNKFNKRDIYPIPITFDYSNEYISKRTHDTKHNHPDLIGTLDKAKFVLDIDAINVGVYDDPKVKILERDFFRKHIETGIISENQELEMILELKYDGISVEADCNKVIQSARTRGDTGIGEAADITPILRGYQFKQNNIIIGNNTLGVKFEAIILRTAMEEFNKEREYNYANCRTGIVGLFGNSDAIKYQKYITLIPIAIDRDQMPEIKNRLEEIEFINRIFVSNGEPLRYTYIRGNYKTCLYLIKKFTEEAMVAREYLNFMFDGIVVSYLDESIREKLGRKNYINKYQMAVKFDPMSKLTTFLGYTYEVGQNGVITPMIHYSPVEFFGTIHPKSSGHSYKRFKELHLKEGDIIQVTYQNDVMPYVTAVDCERNRQNPNSYCEFPTICPECGSNLVLSSSEKTVSCNNPLCIGRSVSRMVNMLQKLNIKGFGENTIRQLNVYSLHELYETIKYKDNLSIKIGPGNAENLILALNNLLNKNIEDYVIIGSLGFTGCASQIWKLIFEAYTMKEFYENISTIDSDKQNEFIGSLLQIKGVGASIADTILHEYNIFMADIEFIMDNFKIIDSKYLSKRKQIRFSGCRNKQLEEQLISEGYDASGTSSVTKKTDILIVPYKGYTSSKTSKVSERTLIIPIDDFIQFKEVFLNTINKD